MLNPLNEHDDIVEDNIDNDQRRDLDPLVHTIKVVKTSCTRIAVDQLQGSHASKSKSNLSKAQLHSKSQWIEQIPCNGIDENGIKTKMTRFPNT